MTDEHASEHGYLRESLTANRERAQPSPGPWWLDESDKERLLILDAYDDPIGEAFFDPGEAAQANARVFAAGHAMLQALRGLVELRPFSGETWNDCFNRVSADYHRETGKRRPPPSDATKPGFRDQQLAFDDWIAARVAAARDACEKAERG